MTRWQTVKLVLNFINLSTLAGFGVGAIGRARFSHGPRGLYFGSGYKLGFPIAGAFTIGNVILTKHERAYLDNQPTLVRHEERHSWQFFWLLGLPMLPLYVVGVVISWLLTGTPGSRNPFEQLAGLQDGGYDVRPIQPLTATLRQTFTRRRN
jgi:hypothetical protein